MFGLVRPTQSLARTGQPASRLQRWDPWTEMEQVRREMDDFVTRAFGLTPLSQLLSEGTPGTHLPIELYETPEQYQLRAHLPGLSREDINLEITGNRVSLWGERRSTAPAEGTKVHLNTAAYGRFQFAYELPAEIKSEEVKASYRDGVLEVTLPKLEVSKPESVKIEIEG